MLALAVTAAAFAGDPQKQLTPLQAPQVQAPPMKLSAPQPHYDEQPLTLSVPTPVYAPQPAYRLATVPVTTYETTYQPVTTLQPVTVPVTRLQTTSVPVGLSAPVVQSDALLLATKCHPRLSLPRPHLRSRSLQKTTTTTIIKS